jgi:hypothetical protein
MFEHAKRTAAAILVMVACAAAFVPADAVAQETTLAGNWSGMLALPNGQEVELIFRVVEGEDGALNTTLDVPAQGAAGIACTETSVDGPTLHISGCQIPGSGGFDGTLNEEGALAGNFNQAGQQLPLSLEPLDETGDSE